jgi:hypothetical protein
MIRGGANISLLSWHFAYALQWWCLVVQTLLATPCMLCAPGLSFWGAVGLRLRLTLRNCFPSQHTLTVVPARVTHHDPPAP